MKKIKRALISVSDKSGLVDLALFLKDQGVEMFSTGGTLRSLTENGIEARSVESYTGFPEMLDGRVKTLHPKIHGGILARRDIPAHMDALEKYEIATFDLLIINLYPLEEVLRRDSFSFEEAIENIDIGGPSMIRSAAKNYKDVAVVVNPLRYGALKEMMVSNNAATSEEFRFSLMVEAFSRTAAYDVVISTYLRSLQGDEFPDAIGMAFRREQELRYGENPHQKAAFYVPVLQTEKPWNQLHGKELSYNNLLDLDTAIRLSAEMQEPTVAIFKHTNPCGVAFGKSQSENMKRAMEADPVSFFGGIVVITETVNAETAALIGDQFFEIVVAPGYDKEAFSILSKKKNIRIIEVPYLNGMRLNRLEIRNSAGGFLAQEADIAIPDPSAWKTVTKATATEKQIQDLAFAFHIVKYVKSNAIVLVKDGMTIGIGAGQMSRVDSMRIAMEKAAIAGFTTQGAVLASDAFFPFRDAVDIAAKAGIAAIVQPGGSMRDEDSIQAADEAGIAMLMSGVRHFRH